jgi:cation-transporting ATPase 13A3/4/5
MACCHGLAWVKGKLVGDPLELKMFEVTKWELVESADHVEVRNESNVMKVLRRFEFSSKLQRMSVIVEDNGVCMVYMKGSPEKLRQLCNSRSIPPSFHKILDFYALNGFRVLGIASK